jgi:hypothetical protein
MWLYLLMTTFILKSRVPETPHSTALTLGKQLSPLGRQTYMGTPGDDLIATPFQTLVSSSI